MTDYTALLARLLPPRSYSISGELLSVGLTSEGNALSAAQSSASKVAAGVLPDGGTTELLPDWERVYGVSPPSSATTSARVAAIQARMRAVGGLSRAFFIEIAAALGYTVTISELTPFRASRNRVGDVIAVPGIVYAWRVSVYGVASAPDLEALIRDLKPAHTAVTFIYPAGSLAGAMSGSITVGTASLTGSIRLINARTDTFAPITARSCTCGVFSMTAAGVWTYVLDSTDADAVALPAKATLSESVTVSASDGSLSGTVLITVVGIDDPATIGGADTGSTTEDVTTTCTGVLTVTDPDTGEAVFVAQTTSSAYGTFVLATSGSWTYTLGAGAQALPGGTTVSDTFTARSKGGASHGVSITIAGTNDTPTITGTGTGSVAVGASTISGALMISDPDTGESSFLASTTAGTYGSLTITTAGSWTYTLDTTNAAVKTLGSGATLIDQFAVLSKDKSTSRAIVITVTGTSLTLDWLSVPGAAAYSLRRLRVGYTGPAIKVRRSSDGATQDIGFTNAGNLDQTALLAFVGSGSGYVVTWYDQSGNAANATQVTAANQPAVVVAGAMQVAGGRAALKFDGAASSLTLPSGVYSIGDTLSANAVLVRPDTANRVALSLAPGSKSQTVFGSVGGCFYQVGYAFSTYTGQAGSAYIQTLVSAARVAVGYYNGTQVAAFTGDANSHGSGGAIGIFGGAYDSSSTAWLGTISEVVVISSALSSSDRLVLERDQGSYYGITVS